VNLIATSLQLGMSVLQGAMGNPSFIWQGQLVRCLPAAITDTNSVISGGFQDNVQARILVKFSDWRLADSTLVTVDATVWSADVGSNADRLLQENGSLLLQENTDRILISFGKMIPVVGRLVTYDGRQLRIMSAKRDGSGAYYALELGAKTK
jgi:hypothetical protein